MEFIITILLLGLLEKGAKLTLPSLQNISTIPLQPRTRDRVHQGITVVLRPDTSRPTNDTFNIIPYTSLPSNRPDAVRRIYERAHSAKWEKWFEGIWLRFEQAVILYFSS